jgi:N4-gp56 family major capsid protein
MAVTDTTVKTTMKSVQSEDAVFYERALLERLLPLLHAYDDAQKSKLPRNSGLTVNWRRYKALEINTTPAGAGVVPEGKGLKADVVNATAKQYLDYVVIPDVVAMAGIDKAMAEGVVLCSEQAALLYDTIIVNELLSTEKDIDEEANGNSDVKRGATEFSHAGKMSSELVRKIVLQLKKKNARRFPDGYYHAIITPEQAFALMGEKDSGWIDAAKYGSIKKLLKGELGELHGVRFMESTNPAWGSTGIIYGADSYGVVDLEGGAGKPSIIKKDFGSAGTNDPCNQIATLGWKNFFVARVLNHDAIYRFTTTGDTVTE